MGAQRIHGNSRSPSTAPNRAGAPKQQRCRMRGYLKDSPADTPGVHDPLSDVVVVVIIQRGLKVEIESTHHIDAGEKGADGRYDYYYEYDLYRFSDGATVIVARSYADEPQATCLARRLTVNL